jgi:hypothetical protein
MQRRSKHASTTIDGLCFLRSPCRGYIIKTTFDTIQSTRVEAGSNTSTVALRVVGGGEKGSLKTETVKYGREIQGTQTRERLRWRGPLVREGAPQKQDRNCQTVINIWS